MRILYNVYICNKEYLNTDIFSLCNLQIESREDNSAGLCVWWRGSLSGRGGWNRNYELYFKWVLNVTQWTDSLCIIMLPLNVKNGQFLSELLSHTCVCDGNYDIRDGPIPHFCRNTDMPISTSGDTPILPIQILLERAASQLSIESKIVKIGSVDAEILPKTYIHV